MKLLCLEGQIKKLILAKLAAQRIDNNRAHASHSLFVFLFADESKQERTCQRKHFRAVHLSGVHRRWLIDYFSFH
jgi:hypothetical protein